MCADGVKLLLPAHTFVFAAPVVSVLAVAVPDVGKMGLIKLNGPEEGGAWVRMWAVI